MVYPRDAQNKSQIKQEANMQGVFKLAAAATMVGLPSAAVCLGEQSMVESKKNEPYSFNVTCTATNKHDYGLQGLPLS
jgi:hypothetical protein